MAKGLLPSSVKAGKPVLGECPADWRSCTYGDLFKIVERPVKLVDEERYQLVTVKRSRGGVVPREKLTGREIKTKSAFEIREGDFLISNRQIVHGACALVPKDMSGAIVSGEYTVLNAVNDASLEYLQHFSHSLYFQQSCYDSSIGVDIEKMVFKLDRWLRTPVNFPKAEEQRKIAEILSYWDRGIGSLSNLLAVSRTKRQFYLRALFQKSRDNVSVALGEVAELLYGKSPKEIIVPDGRFPIIGTSGVVGRTNTPLCINSSIVVGRKGTIDKPLLIETPFWAIDTTYYVQPKTDLDLYWFLALLQSLNLATYNESSGVPSLLRETLYSIWIPLPQIKIQEQIGNLFRAIDAEIGMLQRLIVLTRSAKQFLMQQLLTGKTRIAG